MTTFPTSRRRGYRGVGQQERRSPINETVASSHRTADVSVPKKRDRRYVRRELSRYSITTLAPTCHEHRNETGRLEMPNFVLRLANEDEHPSMLHAKSQMRFGEDSITQKKLARSSVTNELGSPFLRHIWSRSGKPIAAPRCDLNGKKSRHVGSPILTNAERRVSERSECGLTLSTGNGSLNYEGEGRRLQKLSLSELRASERLAPENKQRLRQSSTSCRIVFSATFCNIWKINNYKRVNGNLCFRESADKDSASNE